MVSCVSGLSFGSTLTSQVRPFDWITIRIFFKSGNADTASLHVQDKISKEYIW